MAQELEARTVGPNTDTAAGGPVAAHGGTAAAVGGSNLPLLGGILPAAVAGRLEGLRTFGAPRIVALGLVALAFAAFFAFIINRSLEERYTLLYANLDLTASQEIVRRLETLGVPYRLSGGGDAVMVPSSEALRLRMSLAEEGLPGGGVVGYEIFDSVDPFGTTEFLSNVNMKRALEGELARTIASIKGVRSARVHLVQPKRELFQRERTKPSASVFLSLRVPGGIDRREIAAVRHLVAAAVPGLDARGVTVLDDGGNLLARAEDEGTAGYLMDEADAYRTSLEDRLKRKIVSLLERTVGPGRVDAQVTAALDFDEVTLTEETYDPEGQVVRSTQTIEEQHEANERDGQNGVSVANNLPAERGQQAAANDTSQEQSNRVEETVNYEVSRTVRNQRMRGGRVERLSVAVQVDGVYAPGEDGTLVFKPREANELDELETLVRTAIGLDEERGDTVSIVSRQFVTPEPEAAPEESFLDRSTSYIVELSEPLILLLVTILVLLFGMRPVLKRLFPEPVAAEVSGLLTQAGEGIGGDADAGDRQETAGTGTGGVQIENIDGHVEAALLRDASGFVQSDPDGAVRIIREWMAKT